ncbi:Secondary metabolism regulator LAE1 [Colletotrichum sp. SAR 10_96]|nr:Secondary metabolism regulator LAE1 [Colletotrichum sp. SAR 10_96]
MAETVDPSTNDVAPQTAAAAAASPGEDAAGTQDEDNANSIAADEAETTDAASIQERLSRYTASLSSSVVDYPMEYGRRYHAYRPGWAVEMGDIFDNVEVIGTDLSAIQSEWVPPNVKFEIDDVESPWIQDEKFDYIFCRFMAASIADWPKLIENIYKYINGIVSGLL